MRIYGLIGRKLGHSFSKRFFTEKFEREGLADACRYELFELPSIDGFPALLQAQPALAGLNVTIPYKEQIMPYLHELDPMAAEVGAVNVVKFLPGGRLKGYNSDCIGFELSLRPLLPAEPVEALVLGTGGAAKAVAAVLGRLGIPFRLVSREARPGALAYADLDAAAMAQHRLIVNTTPLGMYPQVEALPPLPYPALGPQHLLYDLVYNPETTAFLREGLARGARAKGGLDMLHGQALAAWDIWNA